MIQWFSAEVTSAESPLNPPAFVFSLSLVERSPDNFSHFFPGWGTVQVLRTRIQSPFAIGRHHHRCVPVPPSVFITNFFKWFDGPLEVLVLRFTLAILPPGFLHRHSWYPLDRELPKIHRPHKETPNLHFQPLRDSDWVPSTNHCPASHHILCNRDIGCLHLHGKIVIQEDNE